MFATRLVRLLLVALSIFSMAQAMHGDAIHAARYGQDVIRRRSTGTGSGPDATTTSKSTTSSQSSTTTNSPTSSSSTPTPTTSSTTASSTDTPTTSSPTPTPSSTSTTAPPSTSTFVVTTTASDGSPTLYTSTSVTTPTPTLANQNGGTTNGMPEATKKIIIGVVVGIGGAIILAVIALVAWRIWGRKKHADENDGLMDYGVGTGFANPAEKVSEPGGTATGRTPFQSTLESYHAPTQVNTASNF